MMKLRINPLVAKDLKSIKDYIAEDNADKALETIQEIYSQLRNQTLYSRLKRLIIIVIFL